MSDPIERLRLWIWDQVNRHGDDLVATGPTFDLILNKIDEFRDAALATRTPREALREPPISDEEKSAIGRASAHLFKRRDDVRGTPAHAELAAQHDAMMRLRRRNDAVEAALVVEAPAAGVAEADIATALLKQLTRLSVGSCSCGVKSPQVQWHDAGCRWRLAEEIRENVEALEEQRAEQWRLRRDAEASRDVARSACDTMRAERDAALRQEAPAADGPKDGWRTMPSKEFDALYKAAHNLALLCEYELRLDFMMAKHKFDNAVKHIAATSLQAKGGPDG